METKYVQAMNFGLYEWEMCIIDHILEKPVSCQKKNGRGHARPSFFWYDNIKDLKVCFLVTRIYSAIDLTVYPMFPQATDNQMASHQQSHHFLLDREK